MSKSKKKRHTPAITGVIPQDALTVRADTRSLFTDAPGQEREKVQGLLAGGWLVAIPNGYHRVCDLLAVCGVHLRARDGSPRSELISPCRAVGLRACAANPLRNLAGIRQIPDRITEKSRVFVESLRISAVILQSTPQNRPSPTPCCPLPVQVLAALDRLDLRRVPARDSGRESSSYDCTPLEYVGRTATAPPDHLSPPWCWRRLAPDFLLPPEIGTFNPVDP